MILLIILVFLVAATSLTIILTIQSETSIRFRCQNYIPVISCEVCDHAEFPISNNIQAFKTKEIIIFDSGLAKLTQNHDIFRLYHNDKIKEIKTNIFFIHNNSIALKDQNDIIIWSFRELEPMEHIVTNPANFNGFVKCVCISGDYIFVGYENIWNRIAVFKRFDYVFSQFLLFHNDSGFQMRCNDKYLVVVSNIVTIFKITKNEMFIPFQNSHFTHDSQIAKPLSYSTKHANPTGSHPLSQILLANIDSTTLASSQIVLSDIYHDKISNSIYVKSENKIHKYSW
jgi:hypothetical protein